MKIQSQLIAHSKNSFGDELMTYVCTFPRYILAELNTHRMFSRNSASSRAIPFKKMVETIIHDPFVPIAWQKDHSGMQGTEYFTEQTDIDDCYMFWMDSAEDAVERAKIGNRKGITKQMVNRILEPFMWHTAIITTGKEGLENFFDLRCPVYNYEPENKVFKSKKDHMKYYNECFGTNYQSDYITDLDWLQLNKGQADIHMIALAESMYDVYHESTPELLQPGEWHIPYRAEIEGQFGSDDRLYRDTDGIIKVPNIALVSSVMCARVSYTVPGHDLTEWTYPKYVTKAIELADAKPLHASPFEHCGYSMNEEQYYDRYLRVDNGTEVPGWCRNFKGFVQLRYILETNK